MFASLFTDVSELEVATGNPIVIDGFSADLWAAGLSGPTSR